MACGFGRDSKTDERFAGEESCVVRARATRRLEEAQQCVLERVLAMQWTL